MSIADYLAITEGLFSKWFVIKPYSQTNQDAKKNESNGDEASTSNTSSAHECESEDPKEESLFRELNSAKEELNELKHRLSDRDIRFWHMHTGATNPAGLIVRRVRERFPGQLVTQAWAKCYEILSIFPDLIRVEDGKLHSLHLCEAPGAFIMALNHYLKAYHDGVKWDWKASSLSPYFEGNDPESTICDDRLMFATPQHWFFGKDNSGNVLDPGFLEQIIDIRNENGGFDFVSGDGGFPCHDDPENQEADAFGLHFTQFVCAIHALNHGGSLLLKKFTHFEMESLILLHLISQFFEKVTLFKPGTSKCGNSEHYVVCVKFQDDLQLRRKLQMMYGADCKHDLLVEFKTQMIEKSLVGLVESAKMFSSHQKAMISFNIDCFEDVFKFSTLMNTDGKKTSKHANRLRSVIKKCRQRAAKEFWETCGFDEKRDDGPDELVHKFATISAHWQKELVFSKAEGTFIERTENEQNAAAFIERKRNELVQWYQNNPNQLTTVTGFHPTVSSCNITWGKSPGINLCNSKFCNLGLLSLLRETIKRLGDQPRLGELELAAPCDSIVSSREETPAPIVIDQAFSSARGLDKLYINLKQKNMTKTDWLELIRRLLTLEKPIDELTIEWNPAVLMLTRFSANIFAVLSCLYDNISMEILDPSMIPGQGTEPLSDDHDGFQSKIKSRLIARGWRNDSSKAWNGNLDSILFEIRSGLPAKHENEPSTKKRKLDETARCLVPLQFLTMDTMNDEKLYIPLKSYNNSLLAAMCLEGLVLYRTKVEVM